jgi:hypothetical protein
MYKESGEPYEQHSWWDNFLKHVQDGWDSTDLIKKELVKYNARWISGLNHHLEFDTEEDAVMFLMRWS